MQPGYVLSFFIFPIFLEGCCVGNPQKERTGFQQDMTHLRYRAVKGEIFMMPCVTSSNRPMKNIWSRSEEGREDKVTSLDCGTAFPVEAKHSGKYTDLMGKMVFHLQVLEKISPECLQPEKSSVHLNVSAGGKIPCPGFSCSGNNTDVIWYKGNKPVSEQYRDSCEKEGLLQLCEVSEYDTGVYFCDRLITDQETTWTLRRAVNVTVIPFEKARDPPRIPDGNKTEEAELGQPHVLTCTVYFDFDLEISPKVQWYMNYGGHMENMTLLHMETPQQERVKFEEYEVNQTAIIKEVMPQHFSHTYTCIASNLIGNVSVTIKLKRKIKVKLLSLVGYPIASFLVMVGLGVILRVKWLEIQLIYRSHFQYGKLDEDEKEFDVFLSYVRSPPSAEVTEGLTVSPRSGLHSDKEEYLSSMDLLNTEEGNAIQKPLEMLLCHVLEDQWGYRLCLMERDVLPGGAFTNDVVLAIKRSQMLICVLSPDNLTNSNAVFVLESGVQALLQKSGFKLLLIWTSKVNASLIQADPPLPTLVQRALKVLPSLDWSSGKPTRGTSNFWRSLKKALPFQREGGCFQSCRTKD